MDENTFYRDFDREVMGEKPASDYRTMFQRERDRIIHSSAFRRLQAKTQVFLSGEYDFYRTRLTHSIEVAQIGRSICHYLQKNSPLLSRRFYIDPDLVEAACLSHDLGHPPFGHAGERTLNRLMLSFGGFEGNAQTLRILTSLLYSGGGSRRGMQPGRALMDAVLKYKNLFGELENPENHFLYDEQAKIRDFVLGGRRFPDEMPVGESRNAFRSIECQIMDWADDTAYSLNDVVDGVRAGFITPQKLERWAADRSLSGDDIRLLEELLENIRKDEVERTFARKIGKFIQACRLENWQNFMSEVTHRYAFRLTVDEETRQQAKFYQKLSTDLVFRSARLHQLDYKWNYILERIFHTLMENYSEANKRKFKLLSEEVDRRLREEKDVIRRARLICDQIAGMTDGFAIRTYKRLFDPDFGSIVDLI